MRRKSRLKNPLLMHVVDYDDVEIMRSVGVSIKTVAESWTYSAPDAIHRQINLYRRVAEPFPPQLSALLESALWRAGAMSRYISAKRLIKGDEAINWDKLPPDLNPWN